MTESANAASVESTLPQSASRLLKSNTPLICAMLALAWANSPWSDAYFGLTDRNISIQVGGFWISKPVTFFINQGLMPGFFLALTLGVKRGIILRRSATARGSCARNVSETFDNAILLVIVATALIAAWFRARGATSVDNGLAAAALVSILVLCSGGGIASPLAYAVLGVGLGIVTVRASLHAGVAAMLLGALVPSWRNIDPIAFARRVDGALAKFQRTWPFTDPGPSEPQQQEAIEQLGASVRQAQSPLIRMERTLGAFVAFCIVPLFVGANAGVSFRHGASDSLIWSVVSGVAITVIVSKPMGALLSSRLALATGAMTVSSRSRASAGFGFRDDDGVRLVVGLFLVVLTLGGSAFRDSVVLGVVGGSMTLTVAATLLAEHEKQRVPNTQVIRLPIPGHAGEHSNV